jgi:hypothetical protein
MPYKLQEFDKDYILSGATKLDALKPIKNIPLDVENDGTLIVDLNDDTTKNNLIPLYTVKVNNEQFQNVVDNEFTEFTIPALDRTPLLEAEIEALKSDRNRLAKLYRDAASLSTTQARTIEEFSNQKFADRLYRSFSLSSNRNPSKLMSKNRRYILFMQGDGNLVIYRSANSNGFDVNAEGALGSVIWASGTGGRKDGPYSAEFQVDTNLVVRDKNGNPIWSSFQVANVATVASYAVLQNNGSLQIIDTSKANDVRLFFSTPVDPNSRSL